ncbi:MAG: SHOCT domain-containing protein [Elusimicrobiota bacterium]|jgi:hypothetical protein
MKNRGLLALVSLGFAAALSGCATVGRLNKLHLGMSKGEVFTVLGVPQSSSAQDGVETLHYALPENFEQALYRATTPCFVRLTGGKVDAYGRTDAREEGAADESQALKLLSDMKAERKASAAVPVAAPLAAPAASAPEDIEAKLTKLKKLADAGLITPAEFEEQKKYLLSEFISK